MGFGAGSLGFGSWEFAPLVARGVLFQCRGQCRGSFSVSFSTGFLCFFPSFSLCTYAGSFPLLDLCLHTKFIISLLLLVVSFFCSRCFSVICALLFSSVALGPLLFSSKGTGKKRVFHPGRSFLSFWFFLLFLFLLLSFFITRL